MLSDLGRRPMIGNNEKSFGDNYEMGFLLGDQSRQEADDRERELNLYRSGSAPPTVEGSLSAIGGLFKDGDSRVHVSQFPDLVRKKVGNGFLSEDDLRSDPSYSSYYYSNVNLNPRLPPPLISKEDLRFAQRLQGGNSVIGDRRKVSRNESGNDGKGAPYQIPPGFNARKQESENENKLLGSLEWENDGLSLPAYTLGSKQKSLAHAYHDGMNSSNHQDGVMDDTPGLLASAEAELAFLRDDFTPSDPMKSLSQIHNSSSGQHARASSPYPHISLGASISRSSTPDPQCIARVPSPSLGTIGGSRPGYSEKRSVNSPSIYSGVPSQGDESADFVSALSGMKLSNGMENEDSNFSSGSKPDYLFNLRDGKTDSRQQSFAKESGHGHLNMGAHSNPANSIYPDSGIGGAGCLDFTGNMSLQAEIKKSSTSSSKHYGKGSSGGSRSGGGVLNPHYGHLDSPNSSFSSHGLGGYARSQMLGQLGSPNLPPLFENAVGESALALQGRESRMSRGANLSAMAEQNLNRIGAQLPGGILQAPFVDPLYLQYLSAAEYASPSVAGFNYPSVDMNYMGNTYMDVFQKAHLGNLLPQQKSQYAALSSGNSTQSSPHGYFASPTYGLSYPGDLLASPTTPNSFGLPANSVRHGDYNMRGLGGVGNFAGGAFAPWHLNNVDNRHDSTLLEEFKSNKTRCFELSEISGHVVEFSVDQYGSRFIQQKLETATTDEKNMVFEEIFSDAPTLMTDVFGNYVIQKFFEHGLANQRRELASKLFGSILTLSLQMYGCRVIQKAIEVVDMDQKIEMVKELDGHVMRCVRDQNGNHVIQKCIECVPEQHIEFIVSTFFDQVVTLSTHPYGCRVIQRVLEHCKDEKTQRKVMGEILSSVSMLAQDQYGNYVVQHVLEHGQPDERSTIIQELAGKIVQMSQQKFASNVVEKCLTFGGPSERQLLVNEIIGTTDENESLQAMMKDQFANYVVQKALEICSDQQRELILTRIKVHLNALKKYTYGKHIVARVEKLVAAGERRIAAGQSLNPI